MEASDIFNLSRIRPIVGQEENGANRRRRQQVTIMVLGPGRQNQRYDLYFIHLEDGLNGGYAPCSFLLFFKNQMYHLEGFCE